MYARDMRGDFHVPRLDVKSGHVMVRRMKSDAAIGGVGSGSRRRGLLLFAVLLVVAQVLLFAFLRLRKDGDAARESAAAPASVAKPQGLSPGSSPVPQATPLPETPAEAARTVASAEPENKPLDGSDTKPPSSAEQAGAPDAAEDTKDDAKAAKDRDRRERAERDRERRDRERAERERERERARLDAEREKARIEMERERAKIELERAERARLEAEREKARLEAERAKLAAQKSAAPAEAAPPARPAGSPDVLVVVVSSRAGSASLSREEIRNIYTGKTTFWPNNTPVRAYNRPAGSPAGRKFFRSLLGMSASAFREHWNELQLSGGGIAPATVTSAESILARVAGASGAIGYVLESELPAAVPGVRLIRFK